MHKRSEYPINHHYGKFLPWNKISKTRIAECDTPDSVVVQNSAGRIDTLMKLAEDVNK